MRIYLVRDPINSGFAAALQPGGMKADLTSQSPESMLDFEWEVGSNVIGDFTWVTGRVVVTERVREALARYSAGFSFFDITMHQDPRTKRPQHPTRRTKPRVWLPYEGPPLHELWVTAWRSVDRNRSTLRTIRVDEVSGRPIYEMQGVEAIKWKWDKSRLLMTWWREPRRAGMGIFLPESAVQDVQIFRVDEQGGGLFCTEHVKDLIERHEFTNVALLEVGETVAR